MKIIQTILGVIILSAFIGCSPKKEKDVRPNILFIMTDDHAISTISAYNGFLSEVAPTPSIDRIGDEGVRFENMLCTNSICGPSRASILTGKHSHINGFFKNEGGGDFDGSQQTFPKLLQEVGYETAVIGKWHLGTAPTGFDYYKVLTNNEGQGSYYDPIFETTGGKEVVEEGKYSTTVIKEDALTWLKNDRDKDKPFMLMYQFKAPHRPWRPGPGYENYLADVELPYPATFNDDYEGRQAAEEAWMRIDGHMNRRDMKITPPSNLTAEELKVWESYGNIDGEFWTPDENLNDAERKNWMYQQYAKDYLRCVKGVDDAIGEMLDYLEASGLAENTIVVYTSDQGFFVGEHGWFDKRFIYEESIRMPCLVRFPGVIKPGTVSNDLLANIDYAPTLLEIAGANIPNDIQGKSFAPILANKQEGDFRDGVYYHYYEFPLWHHVQPHYGMRTDRYKLIHFYYNMDNWELYDLKNDPNEMNNLYGNADYEDIAHDLKDRLAQLRKDVKMDKTIDELREMTDVEIERIYVK